MTKRFKIEEDAIFVHKGYEYQVYDTWELTEPDDHVTYYYRVYEPMGKWFRETANRETFLELIGKSDSD